MTDHATTYYNEKIANAIRHSRRGILMAGSVAWKLKASLTTVQRHLDRMCREGKVECIASDDGQLLYRNLVNGAPEGLPPKRRKGAQERSFAPVADDGGDQDDEDYTMSVEMKRAAALWKDRMGDQRWRDDPRALAERMRQPHMLPPFSNLPVREL